MEHNEFSTLFRDIISHLYDFSVVETHPLTDLIRAPQDYYGSKGEYLRQMILDEIECFKPEDKEPSLHAIEWRPYNILHKRYVEGASLDNLSQILSLSKRQLRRDNSRALRALTGRVWEKLKSQNENFRVTLQADPEGSQTFELHLETMKLAELLDGVADVLSKRIEAESWTLKLNPAATPIYVIADRVIVRQILISLVGYLLDSSCEQELSLFSTESGKTAEVTLQCRTSVAWNPEYLSQPSDLLETAVYWSHQIKASIQESHPSEGETGLIALTLKIPTTRPKVILVIDDQRPTHQMFQRFLNRTAYRVVGILDPSEAVKKAREVKPILITLDVMMPKVDGWEILQALKADPDTMDIPILVCSAWEEPELAQSLGAAGFLKKPVRQKDLLRMLESLNLDS